MKKSRKKAFTLVELLAVIVILAIILVIAVPKVINIINDSKKATLESTAKMVASAAEKRKVQNAILGREENITCEKVTKLNEIDYEKCYIEFLNNEAYVTIIGDNTFEGMYICKGTKNDSKVVDRCPNERVSVTMEANGGSVTDISGVYKEGTIIDIENPIKENSIFVKWEIVKGNSTLSNNKLTVGSEDTILNAKYESWPSLEVDLDGGTDNIEYNEYYKSETLIELEVPTKENYKFVKWEIIEGNGIISGNTLTMGSENTKIKAIYELNVFKLNVELNGGSLNQTFETEYVVGSKITLETPTKTGYTFESWSVSGGGAIISDNVLTMGTEETTITANWKANTYTIDYELNGGTVSENPTSYTIENETFTLNNPTKTGYTFTGWTESNESTSNVSISIPKGSTGNKTYTANYRINKVYVKFHVNGGTITSSTTSEGGTVYNWTTSSSIIYLNGGEHKQKINYGATGDLANYNNSKYINITKTGYVASDGAEWICSSGCTTANKTFDHSVQYNASDFCDASNGDCTVTVKVNWKPKTIKVTFNKNDGSGSTVNQTFTYGVSGNKFGYNTDGTAKWGTSGDFGSWTRNGYGMLGWATSSSATSKNYSIYSSVTDNWIDTNYPSINLYAVWQQTYLYLYKSGNTYSSTTGGWKNANLNWDSNYGGGVYRTVNKIDLTKYKTLEFNGKLSSTDQSAYAQLGIWSSMGSYVTSNRVKYISANNTSGTRTIDISGLSGSYYIGIYTLSCEYGSGSYSMNYIRLK